MKNPIPYDAGKNWSNFKTKIFNTFFTSLRVSFIWKGNNLEFLKNLKSLKEIVIESVRVIDIKVLEECVDLESIVIECKLPKNMQPLDLTKLSKLKFYLGKDFAQIASLYNNQNIKRIHIYGYRSADLSHWQNGAALEHILIDDSKELTSLMGIENMANLKLVEIENCPNLKRPTLFSNNYPFLRIYVDGELQK
jgi:hypothetical protein